MFFIIIKIFISLYTSRLMAIPATVVYFSLYDVLKDTYSSKLGAVNGAFLAGVLARGSYFNILIK
jgi:hypothetical protein